MGRRLLMVWYGLLILLGLELIAYGLTGYLAIGYRTMVWEKFNKEVQIFHEVDNKLPYAENINRCAREVDINPRLIASIIQAESSFQPRALSRAGAYGLMQIMPDTWRQVNKESRVCSGRHQGECTSECYYNSELNIRVGTNYIKTLVQKYQGNMLLAVAAYNAGPGAVEHYGGIPPYKETEKYVECVIGNWYMFENKKMPYSTVLLIKQWDKAHQLIGWCLVGTIPLLVWILWRLVTYQSSWCWR